MPIYATDEHELMNEESVLKEGEAEIQNGTLYLTDRRIIYEIKGKRGFVKASPAKTYMDVPLHKLKNVTASVPLIRLFTKKYLIVEFERDGSNKKYEFLLTDPKKWHEEIVRWVSDARRHFEDDEKRRVDEEHKREVEMANAKSSKMNIGVAYIGKEHEKDKPEKVDVEEGNSNRKSKKKLEEPKYISLLCDECNSEISQEMKFCPNCGAKVNQ